jgi:hypothetical protein
VIYFLLNRLTNRVKIGYTAGSVPHRQANLETGAGTKLELLAAIPGDMQTEASLHRLWESLHQDGEWFDHAPPLATFIAAKAKEFPELQPSPEGRRPGAKRENVHVPADTPQYLSPGDVAERLGLAKTAPVLAWIHAGQLAAVNVSVGKKRSTYRIGPADLAAFLERRRVVPKRAPEPERTKRRRTWEKPAGYTRYFS